MSNEFIVYLFARLLKNAKEAASERRDNPTDEFVDGKSLAYYEVMDVIKNECEINGFNLSEFNLDLDLDKDL